MTSPLHTLQCFFYLSSMDARKCSDSLPLDFLEIWELLGRENRSNILPSIALLSQYRIHAIHLHTNATNQKRNPCCFLGHEMQQTKPKWCQQFAMPSWLTSLDPCMSNKTNQWSNSLRLESPMSSAYGPFTNNVTVNNSHSLVPSLSPSPLFFLGLRIFFLGFSFSFRLVLLFLSDTEDVRKFRRLSMD